MITDLVSSLTFAIAKSAYAVSGVGGGEWMWAEPH